MSDRPTEQTAAWTAVRCIVRSLLLLLPGAPFTALPAEVPHLPAPVVLFDGRHLTNFYSWLVDTHYEDPRRVFSLTNEMIRISGDGLGYLATRTPFRQYRLTLEFKWGQANYPWGDRIGKARDSGVFLHATGPDGNSHDGRGAFKAALECNVFQGATGDFLLIRGTGADRQPLHPRVTAEVAPQRDSEGWYTWLPAGRPQSLEQWGRINWFGKSATWKDVLDFRGPQDFERAYGEWNELECACSNQTIRVRLNGTLVNEVSAVFPSAGQILLQCEGSEIFFKNIKLHPLPLVH